MLRPVRATPRCLEFFFIILIFVQYDSILLLPIHVKNYIKYCECFDCSKEYASSIVARIDANSTLQQDEYFLHSQSAAPLSIDARKSTGSSYVSVVGPNDDFVATTVSVNL